MRGVLTALAAGFLAVLMPAAAAAEEAVAVGGALALLNKGRSAQAGIVLIPGGSGILGVRPDGRFASLHNNQLVRTRGAYARQGFAVLTIDRGVDPAAAVRFLRGIARVVAVVATSRGTLRVAGALGARPNGIVLTSGFLDDVRAAVGSPAALPRTLIVAHRSDGCRFTSPAAVAPFKGWGGAKVQVAWMEGGTSVGNPCRARAYHGFNGIDGAVVSTVARFVRSLR